MLTELSIRNFAIIDNLTITFQEGLTVLSGETGAGKSIIIDAIQLLAGGRSSVEFVRHGEDKAEIEGLFSIDSRNHPIYEIGKQYGVETSDNEVVLNRVITSSGKSICRVNGKLVTLGILREFGRTLIDIHSQHETQSLMVPEYHIDLLDMYNRDEIEEAKEEYRALYQNLINLERRYKELNENEKENAQRLDLLEFQLNELANANLVPKEDVELEKERNQLVNYEKIFHGVTNAYNALYGENKAMDLINNALKSLEENQLLDETIAKKHEELSNHYYMLEDLTFDLSNYIESLEFDPNRLNEIEGRLAELGRLKKKYGSTVDEMIDYMGLIEEETDMIKNKESHLEKLTKDIREVKQDAFLEAKQLHDLRKNAAASLTDEVHLEFQDLYLEKATFSVQFKPEPNFEELSLHKNGFDEVRFLISTNLGEPLKDISKVASGGELSRIMLVLKKLFAKHQGVTSVIFDEVDTGVSGRVAQAIAEKIFQISIDSQVLCISHLPQVAAMADTHLLIKKDEINSRTITHVTKLSEEEQIDELSRMITGTKLTETAKEHGKELLELAESYKKGTLINN